MQFQDRKIDAAMQSFAKKWMKSMDRPRVSTSLGYFFIGVFILLWSSSISSLLGFKFNVGQGVIIFVAVGLILSLIIIFINKFLVIINLERPIRSALFLSALIGPYINLTTYNSWNLPVISHLAGFIASIMTFTISYLLDTTLGKYQKLDK
jgi:hypothetical protein